MRPSQVYTLRTLVYDRDPGAFLIVVSTDEVLGEGFKPVEEERSDLRGWERS